MKLPLSGVDRVLWIGGVAAAVIAIGILAWTQLRPRAEAPAVAAKAAPVINVPSCSDPDYLRDVGQIASFNGLKSVRFDRELSSEAGHRRCGLMATDKDGKDVRVRGLIRRVGDDLQLSVEME